MAAGGLERGAALLVDQPGQGFGKGRARIRGRGAALGLDEECPAGLEAAQRIVEPRGGGDELALRRAVEVGAAKAGACVGTSRPC